MINRGWLFALCLAAAAGLTGCGRTPVASVADTRCAPDAPEDARGVWVPGGSFQMGSEDFYPEERPVRRVEVAGFFIDPTEVTNAQFAAFVAETGYVTEAERPWTPPTDQATPAEMRAPGSAVFRADAQDLASVWRFTPGASWRHPEGPGNDLLGREREPVVHVTLADALAYARWAGRDLPTEAEWERAARGGVEGQDYIWGAQARPKGQARANVWDGVFPVINTGEDGYRGRAPVGCFPANGYGLYDMAGNVWEWTKDAAPDGDFAVIKGGSFLCAESYCGRFRPAARQPGDRSLGTSHIGFRTVLREGVE